VIGESFLVHRFAKVYVHKIF